MRIQFSIYARLSNARSEQDPIGNFTLDSIPTSYHESWLNSESEYNLINFLDIITNKSEYNGEYFVRASLLYIDKGVMYPKILLAIKENIFDGKSLYLTGKISHSTNEMFSKVIIKGKTEKQTQALVIPRTTLDYIYMDDEYYKCDKIIFKKHGEVEINVSNDGLESNQFFGGTFW